MRVPLMRSCYFRVRYRTDDKLSEHYSDPTNGAEGEREPAAIMIPSRMVLLSDVLLFFCVALFLLGIMVAAANLLSAN